MSEKWSQEELQQLTEAKAEDPATWPKRMQDRWQRELSHRLWDCSDYSGLANVRYVILEEALRPQTAAIAAFISESLDAVRNTVEKDSLIWKILFALDTWAPYGLLGRATSACMDLVPKLDKLVPLTEQDAVDAMLRY